MVIKNYKIFEDKLQIQEEMSTLLELAIDTQELDLVKFFVEKGARSGDNTMESASYNNEIFKYLLEKYEYEII